MFPAPSFELPWIKVREILARIKEEQFSRKKVGALSPTGGYARLIASQLPRGVFIPHLTLEGLRIVGGT